MQPTPETLASGVFCFPERSNTPGTAYISYRKDGTFDQYIVFDASRMPIYRIDYGTHRGKKTLHVHYYKDGDSMPNPPDLKKGDLLYEKHKHLFKGGKMMQGITMEELYELISHCHDAEFEYKGTTYVLQPEVNDNKAYLVIWDCTPDSAKCICKHEIGDWEDIPQNVIDAVLSDKCFDGKSFLEIEKDITVTVIY